VLDDERVVVDGRLSYVRAVPYRRLESVELPDVLP